MKKYSKYIRIALIALVVIALAVVAVLKLKIEPADPVPTATPTPAQSAEAGASAEPTDEPTVEPTDTQEPEDTTDPGETAKPGDSTEPEVTPEPTVEVKPEETAKPTATPQPSKAPEQTAAPTPEESAAPSEEPEKKLTCTFEIRCDTLLDTSKVENEAILPYIPSSGVILATTEVEFEEGDSVFEALKKVTRANNIQMEFRDDPLYSGAYIEGINYLYEFDGGTLSGWMYKVNGKFPNYGCSKYYLEDGDEVVWMYTCDLGRDVGDNSEW